MRILVLTNMYPPHHYGGYELNCQEFVTAMRSRGHEVSVLTSDHHIAGVAAAGEQRADVRRDLRLYWRDHEVVRPSFREAFDIERANQAALRAAIDAFSPDIVSVWHMGCMSLGLLVTCGRRGLPLVYVVNDDWLVYGPLVDRWMAVWRRRGPLARVGEQLFGVPCRTGDLGATGTFCFISEATQRAAEQHGRWRFPDATIGYCGMNIDDFPIGGQPRRTEWSGRLLHVGRIDDRKGIDAAIRAVALLDASTSLDVVGRGDERHLAALRQLAADVGVGDRVRFRVAERHELASIYGDADALLFPPRWAEPFGLVPLEAMACSTPVIATATGGSSEFLIHERNCLVIPVDDAEAMAAAVRRLSGDDDLRRRLVAGGLETATELTLPRWLKLLETWHVAAGERFANGRPAPRERIGDVLARVFDR